MAKHIIRYFILSITSLLASPLLMSGQEKTVLVERCKVIDQSSPINNIWVDKDNIKWIANTKGLYKLLAIDVVEQVLVASGTTSLLSIRGGNAQIEWNTAEMQRLLGNVSVMCASYDEKTKNLWIGTRNAGAFQVALSPLRIVQRLHTGNKKLTSDQVNDIFIHTNGTVYIATNDGMLTGSGDRWDLQERYLNFIAVDAWGDNLWILGDDFLWQVDNRGKWSPIPIERRNVEGQMRDITVDDEGRVWIASNMMTGYDVNAEKYQRFGPGQYFTSQFVNCLDVDQDGSIWTGTEDKGLYMIQWESSLILTITGDTPLDCSSSTPAASISVKVGGGKPPYTYTWSNGQNTPKITGLTKGDYSVTVTDADGLTKTGQYNIPDPNITVSAEALAPASGASNGSAAVTGTGGSGQYIYSWDNGEMTSTATQLSGGVHTVTVSDKSGCSAVASVTISENLDPLQVSMVINNENKCAGAAEGSVSVTVRGGKNPYKITWNQGGSGSEISSLASGTYTVTVTDAAGNAQTATTVLNLPEPIVPNTVVIQAAGVDASNGQAQVKASGGKTPYSFAWDNGETSAIAKSLTAGMHTVTITDINGCTATATVNVGENITTMNASLAMTGEIRCYNDTGANLEVTVTGGKGPYTFNWSNGGKTQKISNLQGGIHQVTVTDALGSIVTADYIIDQPEAVNMTIQAEAPATAAGNDGRASVRVTGGSGSYQYAWDNGETASKASRLSEGLHKITVTDGNGCTAIGEVNITESLTALLVTVEQKRQIQCAGESTASLEAIVSGGKPPYQYTWSVPQTGALIENQKEGLYTLTVTDAAGFTATFATTVDAPLPLEIIVQADDIASANNADGKASVTVKGGKEKYTYLWDNGEKLAAATKLSGGLHSVTVTDQNGCSAVGSVEISENIQPLAVVLHQDESIHCIGGNEASLRAEIRGGKKPLIYLWKNKDRQWSTETITGLNAGFYSFMVTDAAGTSWSQVLEIKDPEPLQVTGIDISPASTGKADGTVTLKVTGGKLPYSLNGARWSESTVTNKVTGLAAGEHKFSITDAFGCMTETTIIIPENVAPLAVAIRETQSVLCAGGDEGSLEVTVAGGKSPFTYRWGNGQSSSSISNLNPGSYTITVSDAAGQSAEAQHTLKSPAAIQVSVSNLRSATNDRLHDGRGTAEVKGGTGPYKYSWNSGETTMQAMKLPLGTGHVIVTDQNGCSSTTEFVVREKVLPELTAERLSSGEPIRMEKIQFDADSIKVNEEAIPSLDELYEFLYDHPTVIIEVAGHTNGLPADEYCDRISAERAQSVANYLINKGIENRRVISKGYGKRKPIATNQTPEGRKRNQRVEIRLIKIEE